MTSIPALGLAPTAWAGAAKPGAPALTGRFQITANRPWTRVFVGGRGPFRFLIDTGASVSVIDPDIAAQLGLARIADAQLQGATAERTVEMYRAEGLIVADTLRQRSGVTFAAGRVGGGFDGALPGAMFTSANTEIDFAAREFRFYAGAPDRTGFTRLGLVRGPGDGRLVVQVRLDGRPVDLLVDTGGAGSVLLSGEYVGKNELWDRYPKWAPGEGMGMLTGFNMRLVRADTLQLGPKRFDRPVVHLTDPFNPPGDGGDGVLGMDVLRRFTLLTDPAGQALWIKPNAAIDEPFRYNRAGFELGLDQSRCSVRRVAAGSPADRAGVKVGDVAPAVTTPQDLARFDWFLGEGPGSKVEFELQRDGQRFPVVLVLEELL